MEEVNRIAQENGLKIKALVADPKSKSKGDGQLPAASYAPLPIVSNFCPSSVLKVPIDSISYTNNPCFPPIPMICLLCQALSPCLDTFLAASVCLWSTTNQYLF